MSVCSRGVHVVEAEGGHEMQSLLPRLPGVISYTGSWIIGTFSQATIRAYEVEAFQKRDFRAHIDQLDASHLSQHTLSI